MQQKFENEATKALQKIQERKINIKFLDQNFMRNK